MSEELRQRYPKGIGKKVGRFELFETQLTTISQYSEYGLLPDIDYGSNKSYKPDALVIDRIPDIHAIAVGEYKNIGEITDKNWEEIALNLVRTKSKPLGVPIAFLTDTKKTYWINGLADPVLLIESEDENILPNHIDFSDETFVTAFEHIVSYFNPNTNIIKSKEKINPQRLSEEIWQTVWRLKADSPEDCLATFVELFVFKFLDDLGLLRIDEIGNNVSLSHVMSIEKQKSFKYYYNVVRKYIKQLFPAGPDGYSIINGIVLQESNADHNIIFYEIMKKFISFGPLKNTDPGFKSKLYESFLQESKTTSSFGQHFTPRKIVEAIHEMAGISELPHGRVICDPACGVGGFILEQMAKDLSSQWVLVHNDMKPVHNLMAFDIVPKTTILAKANALVHCGDYLADQPARVPAFAQWLNNVFKCCDTTALGSLEKMETDVYDIILTNPPFVVSGSKDIGKLIKTNKERKEYFSQKYSGVEGLFVQFIIKALKPNGDAWVLLPESFFLRSTDTTLRNWMLENCKIDFMALLPERTFFNTPKRVVIIHMKKRTKMLGHDTSLLHKEKTLMYSVGEIGETRDSRRLPCSNDLPEMVKIYKLHKAGAFISETRAAITSSDNLYKKKTLNLRHFWERDTAISIGLLQSQSTPKEELSVLNSSMGDIKEIIKEWESNKELEIPLAPEKWKTVTLGDTKFFKLRIGKRVVKKDIYQNKTDIPLYSANIRKAFGFVYTTDAGNLEYGGALWSIDSDFDCRGVAAGETYAITDHCGQIELTIDNIDPDYLAYQIFISGKDIGFNREFRPSLQIMKTLEINLPIRDNGEFDFEIMKQWSVYRQNLEHYKQRIKTCINNL